MKRIAIPKTEWNERLTQLLSSHEIYAPVENDYCIDYARLTVETIPDAVYNKPKPVTPLKNFFLPVKENVTSLEPPSAKVLILGIPNCDIMALAILDAIYLDGDYPDPFYRQRRENTTLISSDCLSIQEHCHCTSYGIEPRGNEHSDLSANMVKESVILSIHGKKGEALLEHLGIIVPLEPVPELLESLEKMHAAVMDQLKSKNEALPGYHETGQLVSSAPRESLYKYASNCVSCGACSAICPTCSCFLLIDRPGYEKIRQLDTCQYPGFERVASGEDALGHLPERFRNRYMCKYVWKTEKYGLQACTGCGRCIETCIGKINKNEWFVELSTC
jgi:sulfhydrogenase subunit beta (sulfur reductase)